jgi:hypothetical protein
LKYIPSQKQKSEVVYHKNQIVIQDRAITSAQASDEVSNEFYYDMEKCAKLVEKNYVKLAFCIFLSDDKSYHSQNKHFSQKDNFQLSDGKRLNFGDSDKIESIGSLKVIHTEDMKKYCPKNECKWISTNNVNRYLLIEIKDNNEK